MEGNQEARNSMTENEGRRNGKSLMSMSPPSLRRQLVRFLRVFFRVFWFKEKKIGLPGMWEPHFVVVT